MLRYYNGVVSGRRKLQPLVRLCLVRRKLVSRCKLLLRVLLSKATGLLPQRPRLLALVLLVQLSRWSSNLGVSQCLSVIRATQ